MYSDSGSPVQFADKRKLHICGQRARVEDLSIRLAAKMLSWA